MNDRTYVRLECGEITRAEPVNGSPPKRFWCMAHHCWEDVVATGDAAFRASTNSGQAHG